MDNKKSIDGGYTLLFAMIVASIVLALGVSLLTISRKEFVLSSSAVQSTDAFYAADSGISCAEYWAANTDDTRFSTSTFQNPGSIVCSSDGRSVTVYGCSSNLSDNTMCTDPSLKGSGLPANLSNKDPSGNYYDNTYEFTFYVPFSTDGTPTNKSCAAVSVERYLNTKAGLGAAEHPYTDITSAGYNIGWNADGNGGTGDCSNASPKKVNRTLEVTY